MCLNILNWFHCASAALNDTKDTAARNFIVFEEGRMLVRKLRLMELITAPRAEYWSVSFNQKCQCVVFYFKFY